MGSPNDESEFTMDSPAPGTAPFKCSQCDRPGGTLVVCDFCHRINPAALVGADYFTLLGVERRYDLDEQELTRKFLTLNRHTHPDVHSGQSVEAQSLALQVSAAVNDAYRTLKDPAGRAAYLLELLGGKSSAEDKSVPEGFLATTMMMQEEIADARMAGGREGLERLRGVLKDQLHGLLKRIGGLFEQHQQAVACKVAGQEILRDIRKQLNAVSYVRKLLTLVG